MANAAAEYSYFVSLPPLATGFVPAQPDMLSINTGEEEEFKCQARRDLISRIDPTYWTVCICQFRRKYCPRWGCLQIVLFW